jgi:alpha-1,3-rhamnosyltransferase
LTTNPRLTVLLLCWNHERYIEQCIDALAAQTSRDFDVIFLDNVSTDGSAELAARLLASSGIRHRILRNDRPQSISTNLNRMLGESTGELISFLSTDDWYAPRYVEAMTEAADARPDIAWFSSGAWNVDDPTGALEPVEKSRFEGREDIIAQLIAGNEPFFFAGHCYRRKLLTDVGGWDGDQLIEDADLFYRLAQRTRHWIVDEKLFYYRKHPVSASRDPAFMILGLEKFFEKHGALFPQGTEGLLSSRYRLFAAAHADRREWKPAVAAALKAIRLRPLRSENWRTMIYALRCRLVSR